MTTSDWQQRWDAALMGNYGTPSVVLARGEGATVWDVDGNEYVDLFAGLAVNVLGHAHPAIRAAVDRQLATLGHVSNLAISQPVVLLAERLKELTGFDRVLFTNSGAEANEAGLKLSRRVRPGGGWVACERAFHGRTLGALAVTGQPSKREPFEPLPGPVTFVPYGDVDALRQAVTGSTASVILEPVLGEAGVVVPPPGFLEAAREICTATGALLHLDEVQGGIGRAGAWLSVSVIAPGVEADIVTLAKGLGGGLPIGAVLARGVAASALHKGDHGTTFGGNPVVCAAALAVLDTVEQDGLLDASTKLGNALADAITGLGHPLIDSVRGAGLWRGIVLTEPVAFAAEKAARDAGFLINAPAADVLRLAPPLVVREEQLDAFVAALPGVLDAARVGAT
ncbi:MAG: acetylornithine/N-succinyldiaminopimelate aminotransferase [Actinomycetota bacterium]|jgi:acetylornithine aminotransferase|nr:acetylornithine/N-succinyldiaminopimelate aminotransferase [Actinomycetota bacterium]